MPSTLWTRFERGLGMYRKPPALGSTNEDDPIPFSLRVGQLDLDWSDRELVAVVNFWADGLVSAGDNDDSGRMRHPVVEAPSDDMEGDAVVTDPLRSCSLLLVPEPAKVPPVAVSEA
eukprot:scaffold41040_cov38-Attheya_sp.AAC.2